MSLEDEASSTRPYIAVAGLVTAPAVLLSACGGGNETPAPAASPTGEATPAALNPADFQARVDNPFFPLASLGKYVYEGEEVDSGSGETVQIRIESTVLPETAVVAGVEVTVVEVKELRDGELAESTLDYFAQHKDGSVYYLGERVDNYEDGKLVNHEGQWLAGEGDNQAGILIPADPQLGVEFQQEIAPGVAEDQSKVIAVDQTVTTPAGTFSGCVKTEDFDPLSGALEFRFYCPGVGVAREELEDGQVDLVSY